jgi:hypothetical protein
MVCMPKLIRRAGPIGVALTAYDLWKRLPPKQRKVILDQARRHGPQVLKAAVRASRNVRGAASRRPPS